MIKICFDWLAICLGVPDRLHQLSKSVALAEQWMESEDHMKLSRILISGTERLNVTGTQAEVEAAAMRMSRRTKACVTVAVAVAHYHRRNCGDLPRGGFTEVGD
jgi:hypothetical protein